MCKIHISTVLGHMLSSCGRGFMTRLHMRVSTVSSGNVLYVQMPSRKSAALSLCVRDRSMLPTGPSAVCMAFLLNGSPLGRSFVDGGNLTPTTPALCMSVTSESKLARAYADAVQNCSHFSTHHPFLIFASLMACRHLIHLPTAQL
jgi:hypothetical protein